MAAWSYKYLWLFGFFLIFPNLLLPVRFFQRLLKDYTISYSTVLAVVLISALPFVFIILRIIAAGGMIHSTPGIFKKAGLKGKEVFKSGLGYFFQTLLLHLIFLAVLFIIGLISYIFFSIVNALGLSGGECLYKLLDWAIKMGLLFCAVTVAGVIFSFAQRYSILDSVGLIESFKKSFALFRNNLDFIFRLALVHLGTWLAFAASLLLIFLLLSILFGLMGSLALVVLFVIVLCTLVVANGFLGTALHITYTHAFLTLTKAEALPDDFKAKVLKKQEEERRTDSQKEK